MALFPVAVYPRQLLGSKEIGYIQTYNVTELHKLLFMNFIFFKHKMLRLSFEEKF